MRQRELIWGGAALAAGLAGAAAQRRHMRRIASDPAQAFLREPPRGHALTVRSEDGTSLHVEEFGPADAERTIVLVHGWTEALTYWIYQIRELTARGFHVVAYDLRGHGTSERPADRDYSIPRFGQDLEAVLRKCVPDGRRALVAGHSMGGMSIVSWAEQYDAEERVHAAALINTGMGDLLAEQLLIPVPWVAQLVNRTVPPRLSVGFRGPLPRFSTPLSYAFIRYLAFGPETSPAHVAFFERILITCPPDVRSDVGIALSELDLVDAIPHLTVPTVVIAGEDDRMTPPGHAERIAEALPHLERLIVLPATGHMSPLERPAEVTDALVQLAAVAGGERVTA